MMTCPGSVCAGRKIKIGLHHSAPRRGRRGRWRKDCGPYRGLMIRLSGNLVSRFQGRKVSAKYGNAGLAFGDGEHHGPGARSHCRKAACSWTG